MGTKNSNFILKTIIFGIFLTLLTPLIVNNRFFFPFVGLKSLYFMAIVEIIFALWLILIISDSQYRPKFNLLTFSLILMLIILVLSSVFGEDFSRSFWSKYERMTGLLMWFHLFAFFLVISSVLSVLKFDKIFIASNTVASFISVLSLLPKMHLAENWEAARAGATIGNSSFLAAYLLFHFFLSLYLFFKLKTKNSLKKDSSLTAIGIGMTKMGIYSGVTFILTGLGIFLSDGRAAILSALIGLFLLFIFYLISFSKKKSLVLLGKILLICFLLFSLIFVFFVFQKDSFVQKEFVEKIGKARIINWEIGFKGWLERPLLGFGPENYELIFSKYYHPCLAVSKCGGEVWFDRAHNIVADTLVSSGILGLISYLMIFFSCFWFLWKSKSLSDQNKIAFGFFSIILICYFLQNLTVFDMINSYLIFFLILGFISVMANSKSVIRNE